jgi:hypothetical protein
VGLHRTAVRRCGSYNVVAIVNDVGALHEEQGRVQQTNTITEQSITVLHTTAT